MGTSLPCVYSHIGNHMHHSEAAKVHVNCVSRDNNNPHMVVGHGSGCEALGGKWQYLTAVMTPPNVPL